MERCKLVLLPGLDGTGRLFAPLIRELPSWLVALPIAYPTEEVRRYAELESEVMAGIRRNDPFLLLGESFSGPLALRIAARRPAGLIGLVLAASFVSSPVRIPAAGMVPTWLLRLRPPAWALRRWLLGKDCPSELVDELRAVVGSVKSEVIAARVKGVLQADATQAARACSLPILYLAGARDRLVGRWSVRELLTVCPETEVVTLDAPHLVLQRAPKQAAEEIRQFARRRCGLGPAIG